MGRVELDAPLYLTSACLARLAVVFGISAEEWQVVGTAVVAVVVVIAAVSQLSTSLADLFRDWRLRRAGANAARLSALEAGHVRAKRLEEITVHLDRRDDAELDRRLRHYRHTSGRVRMD